MGHARLLPQGSGRLQADVHDTAEEVGIAGAALGPGLPAPLFRPRIALGGGGVAGTRQQYDVAPDGRFLIDVATADGIAAPITVIQNWQPGR